MPHGTLIMLGFLMIIMIATCLLMTPFVSRDGNMTPFIDALFTATSATCVTGLVIADTYQKWNLLGQLIILSLIQIGGLGFITIGVYVAVLFKKKIGLKEREVIHESVNTIEVAGVVRLTKSIIKGTFIIEGVGALLLSLRFIPDKGLVNGIYYGIFHAISAFCNAGFDLMGDVEAYASLTPYRGDVIVNVTIILLITIGGIGFIVWDDLMRNRFQVKKYLLHTKIVLTATLAFLIVGSLLFFLLENNNLMKDMTIVEKILTSIFSAVTPRTAGFNTIDTGALSNGSKLLTMLYMFVGGNSGSTAGGIKTTTFVVIIFFALSMVRRTQGTNLFGRRLDEETIKKANAVIMINIGLTLLATMVIFAVQDLAFEEVLFETFSAIGTVGMSTGVTRELEPISKFMIIMLMYCGRIGSLSFAVAFAKRKIVPPIQLPAEKIVVG